MITGISDNKGKPSENAAFDAGRIAVTHARAGLSVAQLPPPGRWGCLMEARSAWLRVGRWFPLGGGHRARADAEAARQVLRHLAAPVDSYRAARPSKAPSGHRTASR